MQLVYQVCYTRYQVSFYLWLIDSYWNIVKFQNIMTKIVCKFSFRYLNFQTWFEFLEKMVILLENVSSVKKLPINDG